jgi:hypothetical protein
MQHAQIKIIYIYIYVYWGDGVGSLHTRPCAAVVMVIHHPHYHHLQFTRTELLQTWE